MTNFVDGWTVPAQAWVSTEWGLIKEGVFLFVLLSLIVSDFVFGLSFGVDIIVLVRELYSTQENKTQRPK